MVGLWHAAYGRVALKKIQNKDRGHSTKEYGHRCKILAQIAPTSLQLYDRLNSFKKILL